MGTNASAILFLLVGAILAIVLGVSTVVSAIGA